MAGGNLKVSLAYNDSFTISEDGINRIEGMDLLGVGDSAGDLVQEGSWNLSVNATIPIVWPAGSYNANENGAFVFIKNAGPGPVEIQMNLTTAERSGSDYEWISMGRLKPGQPGATTQGEFIWMYLASPNEVAAGGGTARGIRVKNLGNEITQVQYGIYSR